jgi:hypothetical protein
MTLKLTLKVDEFHGHHFLKGSLYEDTQVQIETVEIGPFVFHLSGFVYFSGWMTLKSQSFASFFFSKVALV